MTISIIIHNFLANIVEVSTGDYNNFCVLRQVIHKTCQNNQKFGPKEVFNVD